MIRLNFFSRLREKAAPLRYEQNAFQNMSLNESQKNTVVEWVNNGASLSEIQTKIAEEFGIKMTYMDVRFLVDDLDLELRDKAEPESKVPTDVPANVPAGMPPQGATPVPPQHPGQTPRGSNPYAFADEDEVPAGTPAADAAAAEVGKVYVTVEPVQQAGVIVGGGIRFSDGVRGRWLIDATGRLGIDGLPQGYRPSQQDAAEAQTLIVQELRRLGYQ